MKTNSFFAGIDGGGTKTAACVVDDLGQVLGRGIGGPANMYSAGNIDDAIANMFTALTEALRAASLREHHLSGIWIGIAGVGREKDRATIMAQLQERWSHLPLQVSEDTHIALAAALDEQDGIVLIAGTGSNCLGRKGGNALSLGGWGKLLGDEGGAYALGLSGVREAIKQHEGRSPLASTLMSRFMVHLELGEPRDLVPRLSAMSTREVATLALVAFDAAKDGDPLAREIVRVHAASLGVLAERVAAKLEFPAPKIALVGGCFDYPVYEAAVTTAVVTAIPTATVFRSHVAPCEGAARLARLSFGGRKGVMS